ncbi:MAG: Ribonuclease VapC3 [Candidatus Bathyarchaeota archaeon BA2]|nr:MAG: Ribonuclease VapC3 [Candidatus Bathyarchaeota archaeon BA2]
MKSYVVDASVVAKCFIDEPYSDKASEVIDAHAKGHLSLSAPSIIVYELGNIFWRHPRITSEKAYEFIGKFLDLHIGLVDVWSDAGLLKSACAISKTRSLTFYDSSYLAMVERDRVKLVTADEYLRNKAPNLVVLLKEFKG